MPTPTRAAQSVKLMTWCSRFSTTAPKRIMGRCRLRLNSGFARSAKNKSPPMKPDVHSAPKSSPNQQTSNQLQNRRLSGMKLKLKRKRHQPSHAVRSSRVNLTTVVVLGILALTALSAFYIWSAHNRFYIMSGSQGIAYEIDRKTGETWMLRGGNKTPHNWPQSRAKSVEEIPPFDSAKITGNAGLGSGLFSGKIYNGSSWTVTKIIVTVTAKEENGSTRWTRDFAHDIQIQPLTTASLYITVTGEQGIKEAPWAIKSAWGYKE